MGLLGLGGYYVRFKVEDDYGVQAILSSYGGGGRLCVLSLDFKILKIGTTIDVESIQDLAGLGVDLGLSGSLYFFQGSLSWTGKDADELHLSGDIGLTGVPKAFRIIPVEIHGYVINTNIDEIILPAYIPNGEHSPLQLLSVQTPVITTKAGVSWVQYNGEWMMYDASDPIGSDLTAEAIDYLQHMQGFLFTSEQ